MGKKVTLLTLAVLALLSCENPIQSGLGPKVDITVPVITMENPRNVGDRVSGKFDLKINAKDDIGVERVLVAITKDADGKLLPESAWKWEEAVLDELTGLWTYPLDTTKYPDGDLPVMIRAEDESGKAVVFEGMYSSKNGDPEIELQIPAMIEEPTEDRHMELVTGGVMIGIAKDLWGVKQGYPKIQFWPRNAGENPPNPAVWEDMDSYASLSAEEWAAASNGRTALEFRYYAVEHSDPSLPLDKRPNLRPGYYRFRFQIGDVADNPDEFVIYPAEGYYELEVITARELPVIAASALAADGKTQLTGQYHRDPFYISADVSHTTGIYEATIRVQKEGEEASSVLARGVYTENEISGTGSNQTQKRRMATYLIEPGKHYVHTDVDQENSDIGEVADYNFIDGTYNFIIEATSVQTSSARQSLTIYIDTTPPEISITRVQPVVEELNPGESGLTEFTVNGFIAADMSAYDANNIGVYIPDPARPSTTYREIKYLIRDAYSIAANAQTLYNDAAARYFDNPAAPVYKRPGSTASVIIDTTALVPGNSYYTPRNQFLYFIAKDKAGNYSYTVALLNVDQRTDLPRITITGFDSSLRSQELLDAEVNPNRLDSERKLSGTFTDDDAVLSAAPGTNVQFKIYQDGDENPKANITVVPGDLTVLNDGKTVTFGVALPDAAALPDGTYSVEIAVSDEVRAKNLLKPASLTDLPAVIHNTNDEDSLGRRIYFVLDTQPPDLNETIVNDTTNAPYLIAREFSLGGEVSDINGLRSLTIAQIEMPSGSARTVFDKVYLAPDNKFDNWLAESLPRAQTPGQDNDGVSLRDGSFTYEIVAEDVARRTTKLTRDVVVDLSPPVLTVALPEPNSWLAGSFAVVRGTETDNYRTDAVYYLVKSAPSMGAAAPDEFAGKTTTAQYLSAGWTRLEAPGSEWTDNVLLDTGNGGLAEGIYFFYAAAFDAAGNVATNLGSVPTFGVDQTAPNLSAVALTNATDTDPSVPHVNHAFGLAGAITDRNGLATVTLTEQRDEGPEVPLTLTQPANNAPSWALNVPSLPSTPAMSGTYTYTLRVQDRTGRADRISEKIFRIVYDIEGPVVRIDNPTTAADISGSTLYISGAAPDAYTTDGISVWYHIDEAATITSPPTSTTQAAGMSWKSAGGASWADNAELPSNREGRSWLHVRAFDRLGNAGAVANQEFNVDTSPPKIANWTVTPDVENVDGANYLSKDYIITFTAVDTNELRNLPNANYPDPVNMPGLVVRRNSVELIRTSGVPGSESASGSDASGASWSISVDKRTSQEWDVAMTFNNQADGNYSYAIDIYDIKNKENTIDNNNDPVNAHKTFNVWVDTQGPVLTVVNPSPGFTTGAATLLIKGFANDEVTPAGVRVYYAIDDKDGATRGNETHKPEDASFANDWVQAAGSTEWGGSSVSIPMPYDEEGARYIHFVAYDKRGNISNQEHVPFFVDQNNPEIRDWDSAKITAPGANNIPTPPRNEYAFKFNAYDSNKLDSLRITMKKDNDPPVELSEDGNFTVNKADDKTWPVELTFTGQADGNYDFVIEINDIAGKQNLANSSGSPTYKTFSVRVDTQGPVVAISQPSVGIPVNTDSMSISGTAKDALAPPESDDVEVYYLVDDNLLPTISPPTTKTSVTGWTQAIGSTSWYDSADLTVISGEGVYYVHVIAFDDLDNPGNVALRQFILDRGPPQIGDDWAIAPLNALTPSDASYYYPASGAFTISFTAKDSNELKSVEIRRNSVLLSEGAQLGYTFTIDKTDTTNKAWPVTLALTSQPNENYTYEIIIKDTLNQENVADNNTPVLEPPSGPGTTDDHKTFNVRVDTQGPALEVGNPTPGKNVNTLEMLVSGTATDATQDGLTVWYSIDAISDVTATAPTTAALALASPNWTEAPGGVNWYKADVASPSAEGDYYAHFVAFDKLGNRSSVENRRIYVDYYLPYMDNWSAPAVKEIGGSYYAAGPYTLSFDAKDSNALSGVGITRNGNNVTGSASINPNPGPLVKSSSVSLDHSDGVSGGVYSYEFTLTDTRGKFNNRENTSGDSTIDNLTTVKNSAFKNITIRVDTEGPDLSVSSPSETAPPILTTDQLPVRGTAIDAGIPAGVRIYYAIDDDATRADETHKPGDPGFALDWILLDTTNFSTGMNVTLPFAMEAEGERYVHFIAYDQLDNKSAELHRKFFVDKFAPQINGWTSPSGYITQKPSDDPAVNLFSSAAYDFGFTAYDSSGLGDVRITRAKDGGTAVPLPYASGAQQSDPVQGNYTVTLTKPNPQNWTVAVSFTDQADGNYAYAIELEDIAGRVNPANNIAGQTSLGEDTTATDNGTPGNAFKAFNVKVDTTGPDVTITTPVDGALVRSPEVTAAGTASDKTEDWTVWYAVDDGAPATALPGSPPSSDSDMTGVGWKKATPNWSATEDLSGPDGYRYLRVIAYDKLWNPSNSGVPLVREFSVDTRPPEILDFEFTGVSGSIQNFSGDSVTYVRSDYGFSFKAYDTNSLKSVTVTRNGTLLTGPEITFTPATIPIPAATRTVEVTVSFTGQPDGLNDYTITIVDNATQTNVESNNTDDDPSDDHKTFSVRVDTAGPTLTVNSLDPVVNEISAPTLLVSGTAKDKTLDGLTVWYKVDTSASASAPASASAATGEGWLQADGSLSWNKSGVSMVGEGTRHIHFVAFDKPGNVSAVANRTLYVDYHLPYMENWAPTGLYKIGDSYYAAPDTGSYTLAFDAKDSNVLQSVAISRSGAGVPGAEITISPALPGASTHVSLTHIGVNGNYYPYVITLTDTRNKVNNFENTSGDSTIDVLDTVKNAAFKNITVWVDTQGPDLSVLTPGEGARLTGSSLLAQGAAPDAMIPAGVRIYYVVDTDATKPETNKPDFDTGALAGWAQLDTAAFTAGTADITVPDAEGQYYIHFIAYDRLGNQAAPVDRKVYVDKFAPQINSWDSVLITKRPSDTPSVNLFSSDTYAFAFTAHDTNGLGDVRITRAKDGGTAVPLPYASGSQQSDPVQGNYTVTLTKPNPQNWTVAVSFTGQADGNYVYSVELEDIAGRINPANNTDGTENGNGNNAFKAFNVSVDTTGPAVAITSPAVDALVRSADMIAFGSAPDATTDGITVWYAVDNSATAPAPANPANPGATSGWSQATVDTVNWNVTVDLMGKPEGYLYLHVIAYDKLLNTNGVLDRRFSVDISPPQILDFALTGSARILPGDSLIYAGPAYGFTFKANDTNALSSVVVTRNSVVLPGSAITLDPAAPFPADTKTVNVTVNLTGQLDDNYLYTIEITDTAGQTNVENNNTDGDTSDDHKTFNLRVDTKGPELTVDSPAENVPISGDVINVNGTATDLTTNGLSVWFKIDAVSTAVAPATVAAAGTAGWTEASGATSWNQNNVPLATVGEGTRYVHFVGYDKLGNVGAVTNRLFYYDANPPYMKNWAPTDVFEINGSYYAKAAYTLKFDAYDSNALNTSDPPASAVRVTATRSNTVYPLTVGSHTEPGLGSYTLSISTSDTKTWPVTLALTGLADGNVTYEFAITDTRDKTNTMENLPGADADAHKRITIRTDTLGPSLNVAEPINGLSITGNPLQTSGNATDLGLPESIPVYYKAANGMGSETAPATRAAAATAGSGWTLATSDASWNDAIALDSSVASVQGAKRIHFVAYDQLDNSTTAYRDFYVDFQAPHILTWEPSDITTYEADNLINRNNFGFAFVAYDSNALDRVVITRGETILTADGAPHSDAVGSYTITRTETNPQTWRYVASFSGQTDGVYAYGIEIRDIANKVNPADNAPVTANRYKTFSVRIDTVGPVLVFNEPPDGSTVSGSTITIGGTAKDELTPAGVTVWYAIDGSNTIAAPSYPPSGPVWTQTDGSADWYKNAPISSPTEGLLYVHAVAYDSLGNRSNIEHKPFYVDISPPQILDFAFNSVTPDSGVNFAGKAYGFSFKARDSNAMQSVKVSRDGTELFTATGAVLSGTGTGYTYTVAPDGDNKEWTVTVSFTGQADGNYAFNIEAKDIASRENAMDNSTPNNALDDYKSFGVRVDTTGPVLTIVDPVANLAASGDRLYIGGTAPDTNDLTSDNITAYYKIDAVDNTPAPASMADAIATWTQASGNVFWSHYAVLDSSGGEGDRYLHVIAYDKRGNPSNLEHRKFFVDVNLPQILNWVNDPAVNFTTTPYYAGKAYTIKFDAYDSNTLAGGSPALSQSLVKITRNGVDLVEGTQANYTLNIDRIDPKTWPVTLTLTNQADGNYSYSIEIRDATGKENTLDNSTNLDATDDHKSFTIVVDSTPPNTSLTMAPATVSNEGQDFVLADPGLSRSDNVNGVIEFAASAMDPSGLDGVKWFIIPAASSDFDLSAATAKALYGDSRGTAFGADSYTAMYDTTLLTQGNHHLYILARDRAGNVGYNSSTAFTFYVDQRTDRPVVTLTNLAKDGAADPVVSSGFILRGTVKDDDGVDPAALKINIYNGADWYTGSAWTASAPVDLNPTSTTGSGREIGFTYEFPVMTDGPNHRVVVKAADLPSSKTGSGNSAYNATNAAKTGSADLIFELDITPPAITVTDPTDSTYKGAAASISGTLTEMHIDLFRLRLDENAYINHVVSPDTGDFQLISWNGVTGLGTWTYQLPIPSLAEGLHIITLEAVDKAGLSRTLSWHFYVDNAGPVITFRNIEEIAYPTWGVAPPAGLNILREGALALRGDFRDDYSAVFTESFEYRFDANDQVGDWQTTNSGIATIANPGRNPTWALNLENLPAIGGVMPDGPHRVQIRAKDALGNTTTSAWVGFRVDTKDPEITGILPLEANAVFGGSANPVFTLSGTAADANLSSPITLTLNGAVNYPITFTPGTTSVPFNHAVTSAVFGGLPQGSHRFTITAVDEAGRSKTVEWNFIKDTEAPTIEWSNLNDQTGDNSPLFQDLANMKIIGVARDTNGVRTLTSTIEKYIGSSWVTVDSFDLAPGDEAVKNWIRDLADLPGAAKNPTLDGRYRMTIHAVDRGGNAVTTTPPREFRVDLSMPTVAIDIGSGTGTYPLKEFYNGKGTAEAPIGSGPITVSGTASDANGIVKVTAALSGTNAPAWARADAVYIAGVWEVTIPHENPLDATQKLSVGGYTLNVTATDGAGRTNTAYGTFTFDNENPLAVIDLPVKYARVTSSVSIRGSNNDTGSAVEKMYYQFTKQDTDWNEVIFSSDPSNPWGVGGLYSWNFTFTTDNYIGASYGKEVEYDPYTGTVTEKTGTGLWEVSFKLRVVDRAGNETIIDDYVLLLDQFGDIPRVVIRNPTSGSILGGRVYISGTAEDNFYINRIRYRVKANPTMQPSDWDGVSWVEAGDGGFLTSGIGPTVTWQFDINSDGAYNPTGPGQRPVLVQVQAIDAPNGFPHDQGGAESDPVNVLIYFDAGVPRISDERVANRVSGPINFSTLMDGANSVAYADGLQVSKDFVFEASIQDDSGLETIQYWRAGTLNGPNALGTPEVLAPEIKQAGNFTPLREYMIDDVGTTTDWMAIGATSNTHGATFTATGVGSGNGTAYEATPAGEFVYKLRFMVSSDTPELYMSKTGHFTINIMALDNSSPNLRADRSYTLQVDNFYPLGEYTSPNVAAGWYNIRGTARDFNENSGPIQGLDKTVVYFSRNNDFISLEEALGGGHSWNGTKQEVRKADGTSLSVDFPADKYSGITIDWDETGSGKDQDDDGYIEGWYDNGPDKVWSARFDTTQLKDGPVKLHYVIFDKAGNATYYEQTVFIRNHAPTIISATLGTDIFGDQTIGGTRLYSTGYFTNPAFVARNQRLSFNVAKLYGNGAAHYRITPVTQAELAATAIVAGEIYTIRTVGSTDWVAMGAESNTVGTTFVATSNGNGDGVAYKYDALSGFAPKTGDVTENSGNATGNILFSRTDFGSGAGQIPDAPYSYFLIKIWDSTVAGDWTDPLVEAQQLSDQIVVRVRMQNDDDEAPASRLYDLSPHAKNQSKYDIATTLLNVWPDGIGADKNMRYGGLYMHNNAISGHVEPRGATPNTNSIFLEDGVPSTFTRDTVSGKVILRGYARDNQRISGIQLKFGNAQAITIIQVNPSPSPLDAGHFRALTAESGAWVYDDLSLDEHLVEWAYEWDTQTTSPLVGDIIVQAISRDARVGTYSNTAAAHTLNPSLSATVNQAAGTAAPPTENNLNYNTITMAAAPYITSLARGGGYNTTRSKQGWNSFRRSSTGDATLDKNEIVIVNGFNLSLGATGAVVTIPGVATTSLTSQGINSVEFNLANTAESGAFGLTVNSIAAVNNRNDNRNTWNKEASATVEGSSLWNDDRNIHVWQTNNANTGTGNTANRGYFVGSEMPIHPSMTKHPTTGVLHASWSNYARASLFRGTNNVTATGNGTVNGATTTFNGYDPPEHTDIHFGLNGASANSSPTIAYYLNYWAGTTWNTITEQGGMAVYDDQADHVYPTLATGNAYMAESLWHDKMLAQFENPRVVTKGDAIHISYYDTDTKSLKYWYNNKNVDVTTTNYMSANSNVNLGTAGYTAVPNNRWINIDGGFDGHDIYRNDRVLGRTSGGTAGNATSAAGNFSGSAYRGAANGDVGSSSMAGEFSAIDLTSQGYPVIAYYDIANQTVKLAYAQSAIPLVAAANGTVTQWKRQNVLAPGDPNYSFSGRYISMRIDTRTAENRIHMVFYRTSSGDLIYVTGTQAAAGGEYTFEPSVIIDSAGNVGKWADLSLDANGNPWVSYADSAWLGSYDAVKLAYCLTSSSASGSVNTSPVDGLRNPDKWEVITMPTIYNVADKRISIENWDNTGTQFWSAAIGYAADDFYRIGYYIKPQP